MEDSRRFRVDLAIFGGGVAGLWLLNAARAAGYRAVLLEANGLGAGQTRYAQGIVHGGTKYALTGEVGAAAQAVASMPGIWRAAMAGERVPDLHEVKLLCSHQFLWSTASLTSRMAGFFASHLMRSRTAPVPAEERPSVFHNPAFRGQVYRLDEPVLDTGTLIAALAAPHRDQLLKIDWPTGVQMRREGDRWQLTLEQDSVEPLRIDATRLLFAAGKGNGDLLAALGHTSPAMQLRPLRMVMVRGDLPDGTYAHCLAASSNPRITISSHRDGQGKTVWYLGGQLAEDGVRRSHAEQIGVAQQELTTLLPWVDFSGAQWSTLEVERAEHRQADGSRPEGAYLHEEEGVITAWPTKMALAPQLADLLLAHLGQAGVAPTAGSTTVPADWPRPAQAPLPWQEEERWI